MILSGTLALMLQTGVEAVPRIPPRSNPSYRLGIVIERLGLLHSSYVDREPRRGS